jgi:hypothetical protein
VGLLELIVDNIAFGEFLRWHEDRVWFCDWIDGHVPRADPAGGDVVTQAHVNGFDACID